MDNQTLILVFALCFCCCCLISSSISGYGLYNQCNYICNDPIKCCDRKYNNDVNKSKMCKLNYVFIQLFINTPIKPYNQLSDNQKNKFKIYDNFISAITKSQEYLKNKNVNCDNHITLVNYIMFIQRLTKTVEIDKVKKFFISNSVQENTDFLNSNKNDNSLKPIYQIAYNSDHNANNQEPIYFNNKPILPNIFDRTIFSDLIYSYKYV